MWRCDGNTGRKVEEKRECGNRIKAKGAEGRNRREKTMERTWEKEERVFKKRNIKEGTELKNETEKKKTE